VSNYQNANSEVALVTEVTVYLQNKIASLIGTSANKISKSKNIMDLGVDSIGLVNVTDAIQHELNIQLQPTIFFEYLNIEDLAKFIAYDFKDQVGAFFGTKTQSLSRTVPTSKSETTASGLTPSDKDQEAVQQQKFTLESIFTSHPAGQDSFLQTTQAAPIPNSKYLDDDIAVIGMAGQFAGSPDLNSFWKNLASQENLFKTIPEDHFEYQEWCSKTSSNSDNIYCTTGSFIDNVGDFDAAFFNISAKEAAILDPQLRLLLQVIYHTVEDAGYGAKIRGTNTGMYVGACFHDYEIELIRHLGEVSPYFGIGNALTMLANRPSYYLDLKGPSMPLDTACSASLVAINAAISALRQKECDMAFVAGTNLLLSPIHYRYFCAIGALSKSGASYPFDSRADGYIPGEAVGAVLLKPLRKAQADGDRIHAVIKGAAVSHGGYSASFTAPSVVQEAELIKKAWQSAGVTADSISYIEAHGTGTSLGDPIEINGLKLAFGTQTQEANFCAIGTAKAHIGHAEGAAGIAGLLKVILSMQHKTIPAMPHFQELNPYVNLDNSPFYINRENQYWSTTSSAPRRAGISSFGIGGAYAHVIVEEYQQTEKTTSEDNESLFVLSAKSHERLKIYANEVAQFIEGQQSNATSQKRLQLKASVAQQIKSVIATLLQEDIDTPDEKRFLIDQGIGIEEFLTLTKEINARFGLHLQVQQLALSRKLDSLVDLVISAIDTQAPSTTETTIPSPDISLQDIAYTMQVGREALPVRLAIIARDKDDLATQLHSFINGAQDERKVLVSDDSDNNRLPDFFDCQEGSAFIEQLLKAKRLYQLAQLWVSGIQINWRTLQDNQFAQIVSLPNYPFAKKRYWFTDEYTTKAAPQIAARQITAPVQTISSSTRATLAEIWHKHLSIDKLEDNSGFIEVGGSSITTMQVITEINKTFAINLTNSEFMREGTFGAVVQLVDSKISDGKAKRDTTQTNTNLAPTIPVSEGGDEFPASKDQMRLWILAQMYPGNARHNISSAYHLSGQVDLEQWQNALNLVSDNNRSLKTQFIEKNGQVVQVINQQSQSIVQLVNYEKVATEEKDKTIIAAIKEIALKPFDLAKDSLVRVTLFKTGERTAVLSIIAHHIIADISSIDILARELAEYSVATVNTAEPKQVQYGDYVNWAFTQPDSSNRTRQLDYWTNKLANAQAYLNLPLDFTRKQTQTFSAAQQQLVIDPDLQQSLANLAKRLNTTQFALCFTLFNLTLSHICQQNDILIGVPSANRRLPETSDMVGFLANTLVLRTTIDPNDSIASLLAQVKTDIYDAFDHQDINYSDIVEALNVVPPKNHNPLFQVLFNMVERPENLFSDDQSQLRVFDLGLVTLDFDLLFSLELRGQTLLGFMDYNPDLFTAETIKRLLEGFIFSISQLVAAADRLDSITPVHFKPPVLLTSQLVEKAIEQKNEGTLLVVSSFTAEPIADSLKFWINQLSLGYNLQFAGYNQVFQQLLDPSCELLNNTSGASLVLVRYDDWTRFDKNLDLTARHQRQQEVLDEFIRALLSAAAKASAPLILITPPSNNIADEALHQQFDEKIAAACANVSNLFYITQQHIANNYPVEDRFDVVADKAGHVPFTSTYYTALATAAVRRLTSLHATPYKVIVLDCDNTLWQGVVGEVGVEGVVIDDARAIFQQFLIEQQQQGMLLCLASKNNEEDALAVFRQRKDMPLKMEHLVAWKINWNAKSDNIKALANELNLGLDSFIFIDDNPIECAEVKAFCPQLLTLQFPQESESIKHFGTHIWGLEHKLATKEDLQRTQLYRTNVERQRIEQTADSFADFINNLALKIDIQPVNDDTLTRVEQLMLRTNQFNSTTQRHSAETITEKISKESYLCHTVNVSDRFGDYGLVGVLFYQATQYRLFLDSFLLSCRVLGKGVEHAMIQFLGREATTRGITELQLQFAATEKNIPVANFYKSITNNNWKADAGVFLLSSSAAVDLKMDFDKAEQPSLSSETQQAAPKLIKQDIFSRIPNEFTSIEKIEAAITNTINSATVALSLLGNSTPLPTGKVEQQLSAVYRSVLKHDRVSVDASFFDMGGSSLLLVKLASALKQQMDLDISITDLFKYPSISSLAKHLNESKQKSKGTNKSRLRASMQRERIKNMASA
jgi:FkbH-like protein